MCCLLADCPELPPSNTPNNISRFLFSSMFSGLGLVVVSEDSVHYVPGVIVAISAGCNRENRLFLQSCAVQGRPEGCVLRQQPFSTDV